MTLLSCKSNQLENSSPEINVNATITAWHKAAAEANYDAYFNLMTDDAIFIGTDANENWNKKAF
ncbi:MAG: nuclear transport factor 2 family protein, partial [Flavobacterium micromati]|nr:nuclear transport factor 2 family protein [Flavobacterium micromati]